MTTLKILYTGGGTMGSVSPLIAIHQKLKSTSYELRVTSYDALWVGTNSGPEKDVVSQENIPFKPITAGKLRRYFDLKNIIDLFKIKIGFWQAFFIILKFKPDIILSAGSFVSVPVVWAGWLLRVPSIIHQQDVKPGLANKLMAPVAARVTVALEPSLKNFSQKKVVLTGNPMRQFPISNPPAGRAGFQFPNKSQISNFKFQNNLPTVLVVGGGTGALAINKLIWESLEELTKFCNIIHITGKNKNNYGLRVTDYELQYKSFEFLGNEIFDVMQKADIVISRAGMSALTELAYFKKPSIIIPIPNSHQEENAKYFASQNACLYLKQEELDKVRLFREVKKLLENRNRREELGERMNGVFVDYSGEKIIEIISTRL